MKVRRLEGCVSPAFFIKNGITQAMKFFLFVIVLLGAPLSISAQTPAILHQTAWIGNSFGGAQKWVQQDAEAMLVAPDGTVYLNTTWDEAGREVGAYRDGDVVGIARHTHGWGYLGGQALALNSKYLFIGQSMNNEGGGLTQARSFPPKGFGWLGVSRRLRTDIAQPAPFEGGKGGDGDTLQGALLVVAQIKDDEKTAIVGMCADEKRLFVADDHDNAVKIYDAETMKLQSQFALDNVGPMALDATGALWILGRARQGKAALLRSFDADGTPRAARIAFGADADPRGFCLDKNGRVWVADNGPNQQILIFEARDGHPIGSLGERGGIFAGRRGAFGERRFNKPIGVGVDAAGNAYVASDASSGGGGLVLESYAPNQKLNWRLMGLTFVDLADADPADTRAIYSKEERFGLGENGAWTYQGTTLDRFRFPDDPRLHIWSGGAWVRRVGGQKFLFVREMYAGQLQVYRFEPNSEIAVPCALFSRRHIGDKGAWPAHQPARGAWIWRDLNGNGAFDEGEYQSPPDAEDFDGQAWWVDARGDIWLATERGAIRRFRATVTDNGALSYDFAASDVFPHPREFELVRRLRYDAARDIMVVGGTTATDKNQHWKPMGPVLARYDNWSASAQAEQIPPAKWTTTLFYVPGSQGHESCEPMSFDIAGDLIYVPYTGASQTANIATGHVNVYRLSDASLVGSMEPGPQVGEIGLQDIPESLRAVQAPDGETLVFVEDDAKAKILVYRVRPN